ncbi:hydroxycarboxylic acid receptor 2-like [Bombina bombina]|uniref:hydroxycarboxylic acid receptor 2-like n=1 Tax=Bombina bombina TaxID=8345 RepID=UPI00235B1E5B|nr:hydroxycarboxylic acid receptor 2-like [Bombina bombina]
MSPVLAKVLMAEFVLGLISNGLVLWVFCFRIPSWNTSTLYLFNVSLADFLLIVCLPFRALYFHQGKDWHLGDIPCRMMLFMVSLNRAGSIFFLTVVVGDRYFKVVHPYNKINLMPTIPWGVGFAFLMWSATLGSTTYILTQSHLQTDEIINKTLCESFKLNEGDSAFNTWHNVFFVSEFFIPLVIISLCTSSIIRHLRRHKDKQGKIQRTIRSMIFLTFVFIICFLPSTVATIMVTVAKNLRHCELYEISGLVFGASLSLTYLNSVLNPLVIYISSPMVQAVLNIHNIYKCVRKKSEEAHITVQQITSK